MSEAKKFRFKRKADGQYLVNGYAHSPDPAKAWSVPEAEAKHWMQHFGKPYDLEQIP